MANDDYTITLDNPDLILAATACRQLRNHYLSADEPNWDVLTRLARLADVFESSDKAVLS